MSYRLQRRHLQTLLCLSVLACAWTTTVEAQDFTNSIDSIQVERISNAEIRVTVSYKYSGNFGTRDVSINASPEENGGVWDPRVTNSQELPLQVGTNSATLTVTKNPAERDFTSVSVKVCMSTLTKAIVCKQQPYTMSWRNLAPPSPPGAPRTSATTTNVESVPANEKPSGVAPGTCSISGRVSGKLTYKTKNDVGEPVTFTLSEMFLKVPDATQPRRARLIDRQYTFSNLPAGVTYQVFPGQFAATPRSVDVACSANGAHRARRFYITGPPVD